MPSLPISWNLTPRHTRTGAGQRLRANGRREGEGLDQQRGVQQEERRGARRRRCRRWVRMACLKVANDRQNDAGREEGRRIDIGVGAKRFAGTTVGGLVTAAFGMVLAVGRHRSRVSMKRSRADVTEHDKDGHTDEQPGR